MNVQYKINNKISYNINYEENGKPPHSLMERWMNPNVGDTVQPFFQDYKYEVVDMGFNRIYKAMMVNLKPKCESAKRVFEMQCPNFKNKY